MKVGLRARPWAGLDVGESSVKLLALHAGVGGAKHSAAEAALPRANGDAPPSVQDVARMIGECFETAGILPRNCGGLTLGLSGPDVIVKQVTLPIMDDSEVPGALRFEARKHLPFDPQTCVIDWQILGRLPSEKRLEVLLAAVPQARLERALAPLEILGLDADIVDAAPLALTNALVRNAERDADAGVLLDIGHSGAWLTLRQRGAPYFSRRLDFGGRHLTQAIAAALRAPFEEAEEWKLEAGADDSTLRVAPDSIEMRAVEQAMAVLADELRRSFAFYRTLAPLPEPFALWISGNTARLPGIAGMLSEQLDIPAFVFDPLDDLGGGALPNAPAGGPQFAQACGLMLRAA